MSKKSLLKELQSMSHEQLVQIISDAYDARPEIKEYLEFFINPDTDKLTSRQSAIVERELSRVKWGRSRARVTNIKSTVKLVIGFNPGNDVVLRYMFSTLTMIGRAERYLFLPDTLWRYVDFLTRQARQWADEHGMASDGLALCNSLLEKDSFTDRYKECVRNAYHNAE